MAYEEFHKAVKEKLAPECVTLGRIPHQLGSNHSESTLKHYALNDLYDFYVHIDKVVFDSFSPRETLVQLANGKYRDNTPKPETPVEAITSVQGLFSQAMEDCTIQNYHSAAFKLVNAMRVCNEIMSENTDILGPKLEALPLTMK
jgi:hypothetical protein